MSKARIYKQKNWIPSMINDAKRNEKKNFLMLRNQ